MEPPPVRYVTTADGVNIAYSVSGSGPPLLFLGPALGGMAHPWRVFPDWMQALTARFQVIQHDMRGHGLSDRGLPADLAIGDDEKSIEAILDRLQLDRYVVHGLSGVGHMGVRWAARHPDQVQALILNGTVVSNATPSFYQAVAAENWEFFLRSMVPASVSPEDSQRWFEGVRDSTRHEDWLIRARVASESNILDVLPQVRVPTLILHARGLALVPSEGATRLASMVPNSRLVVLSGDNWMGDVTEGIAAIEEFLAELELAPTLPARSRDVVAENVLSGRETEVLRLLSAGRSNKDIAAELVISVRTVERHINHIYEKAGVVNRAEAAAYAVRHGIA
jgi:pimeloyl-ACP methyl ester carboxylesterase/DNA-binding CsgD family transcriptional regulator